MYVDLAGLGDNVPPLQSVAKTAEAFISSLHAISSRAGTTADDVRLLLVKSLILSNLFVKVHVNSKKNPSLKMLLCFLGTGCSVRENRKTMDYHLPLTVSSCTFSVPITKQ